MITININNKQEKEDGETVEERRREGKEGKSIEFTLLAGRGGGGGGKRNYVWRYSQENVRKGELSGMPIV